MALLAAVLPITFGYASAKILGYSDLTGVIVGICLAISSEINMAILEEANILKTRAGKYIVAATNTV